MKKLKLFAFTLFIGTTSLFALNNNSANRIINQEVNILKTSNFTGEKEPNVKLTFTVNSNSDIVVLGVNSKNRDVLNFVRENLNGKKIEVSDFETDGGEKVTITFSVNSESEIVILAVDSKNSDILNYVRQKLNGKKI